MTVQAPVALRRPDAVAALLRPRSIAVVGASERTYAGSNPIRNLQAQGFAGPVYPVNPRYDEIFGLRAFPSLGDLPAPPDATMLCVGVGRVLELAEAALETGCRALVVPGGGYTDSGPEALRMGAALARLAERYGAAACGPNGMGAINFRDRSSVYVGQFPCDLPPGGIAGVFQSGSICEGMVNTGGRLRFSYLVSSGTEEVTDVADYLRFFAEDEETLLVLVYVEGVRRPSELLGAIDAVRAAGKAILLLKAGRSRRARANVLAHSGMLAPDHDIFHAVLRRRGVVLVDDLDELVETAVLLAAAGGERPFRCPFVVSNSGGEASVCLDLADELGLELRDPPRRVVRRVQKRFPNFAYVGNPADAWGVGEASEVYGELLGAAADSPAFDVLAAALDVTPRSAPPQIAIAATIVEALKSAARPDKLQVVISYFSAQPAPEIEALTEAAGIPMLRGLRESISALRHLQRLGSGAVHVARSPAGAGESLATDCRLRGERRVLPEEEARRLLERYGVPLAATILARSQAAAVAAARELGLPVAVKIASADVPHKTEIGGVELPVRSLAAVGRARRDILSRARTNAPEARIDGVLVQAIVPDGVECIAGLTRDPDFGPMVVFGLGGIFTEVLRDAAVEQAPLTRRLARSMVERTKVRELLAGARGRPPADVDALADLLVRLGRIGCERPEVTEIDLNPVFVRPAGLGVAAADALVVTVGD